MGQVARASATLLIAVAISMTAAPKAQADYDFLGAANATTGEAVRAFAYSGVPGVFAIWTGAVGFRTLTWLAGPDGLPPFIVALFNPSSFSCLPEERWPHTINAGDPSGGENCFIYAIDVPESAAGALVSVVASPTAVALHTGNPLVFHDWVVVDPDPGRCRTGHQGVRVMILSDGTPAGPWSTGLNGVPEDVVAAFASGVEHTVVNHHPAGTGGVTAHFTALYAPAVPDISKPNINIASPVDCVEYPQHAVVPMTFACSDYGSGVVTCASPAGPSGGALDTSTAGAHELTVTGVDGAGNARSRTVRYVVTAVAPPPGLTALGPARLRVGLRNNDDIGTAFDLRVEVYKNATALVAAGLTRCTRGLARNPASAQEVQVAFDPFASVPLGAGDVLSVKILTRVGTNADGTRCTGAGASHTSATGLRLYYDAAAQVSRFDATIGGDAGQVFLHSNGGACTTAPSAGVTLRRLDGTAPTATSAKCKDSGTVKFSSGNPWAELAAWSMPPTP